MLQSVTPPMAKAGAMPHMLFVSFFFLLLIIGKSAALSGANLYPEEESKFSSARQVIAQNTRFYSDNDIMYRTYFKSDHILVLVTSIKSGGHYEVSMPYTAMKYYEMDEEGKISVHAKDKKALLKVVHKSDGTGWDNFVWGEVYVYLKDGADLAQTTQALDHIIGAHQ